MSLAEFHDQFPRLCERLLQTRQRGRIGHAYLFIGDEIGFLARFVQGWARVCACVSPNGDGDACGQCEPCRLLAGNNYPERLELKPQSKSRRIVVDDVREFDRRLALAASRERLKIGVIVDADCMGEEAQNAFLKTLEEPPPRTVLFLLSANPKRLLPTVRSRCQLVSLLRNRRTYPLALEEGLFQALAPLRRNAGAAVGLATAHRLITLFKSLHDRADQGTAGEEDRRWAVVAADDKALRKRLEEGREARVEAEYIRLREGITDAIHAWFLQLAIMATGVERGLLPHPEMLEAAGEAFPGAPATWEEAEENLGLVATLLRCLASNVSEKLALESFCLSVAEKRAA